MDEGHGRSMFIGPKGQNLAGDAVIRVLGVVLHWVVPVLYVLPVSFPCSVQFLVTQPNSFGEETIAAIETYERPIIPGALVLKVGVASKCYPFLGVREDHRAFRFHFSSQ